MELVVDRLSHGDFITKTKDENGRIVYIAYLYVGNGRYQKAKFATKGKAKQALRMERHPQFGG